MKVSQLNFHDIQGGAARAAYRIHRALLDIGIDTRMTVMSKKSDDHTVDLYEVALPRRVFYRYLEQLIKYASKVDRTNYLSPNLLSVGMLQKINNCDADIVNLHWISKQMLSIREIGRIRKPVVWTLHDMWVFSGAEHYAPDGENARFEAGYSNSNRSEEEAGFDLNRFVWQHKKRHWKQPMTIVCPSHWLAECVKRSPLLKDMRIEVIPNPLNTDIWRPTPRQIAREILGLPLDRRIVLFGAIGGTTDFRKGADLLSSALHFMKLKGLEDIQLVLFGQGAPSTTVDYGYPVIYLGHLHDDVTLSLAYSAADVMLVPSRQEAFGQTASEAHACGTPVVAFNVGGLPDIVEHKVTGYLARPNDAEDMAQGIAWILEETDRLEEIGKAARHKAVRYFSSPVVAQQYRDVYESLSVTQWNHKRTIQLEGISNNS